MRSATASSLGTDNPGLSPPEHAHTEVIEFDRLRVAVWDREVVPGLVEIEVAVPRSIPAVW